MHRFKHGKPSISPWCSLVSFGPFSGRCYLCCLFNAPDSLAINARLRGLFCGCERFLSCKPFSWKGGLYTLTFNRFASKHVISFVFSDLKCKFHQNSCIRSIHTTHTMYPPQFSRLRPFQSSSAFKGFYPSVCSRVLKC